MFTIDLLKGQGIPVKSKPVGIAVAAVTFAFPVIATIVMLGLYLCNSVDISIQRKAITDYEKTINTLSYAIKRQESLAKKRNVIDKCLSEVASSIGRHIQWSPILVTVVENIPDSMVLTSVEGRQRIVKKKVSQKGNPNKMMDVSASVRILQLGFRGRLEDNCDKAVKDFRDHLCLSELLGPKLEDIKVSQKSDKLNGQDIVAYEIDCVFKPGL